MFASPAPIISCSAVPNQIVHDTLLPYAEKRQGYPHHEIVNVGMGCKFPSARKVLANSGIGKSMTQEVSEIGFPLFSPQRPDNRFFGN